MITKHKLASGVPVLLEKLDSVNSVCIGIFFRVGSTSEAPEQNGIAHLAEHMLFKGTKNRTFRDIAEDADKLGAQMNAYTGKEHTCYYIKTLTKNLEPAIELLSDMVLNSLIPDDELAKEKKVIFEEMKMTLDAPDEFASENLTETVFRGTPLAQPIIGKKKTVGGISRKDVTDFIKRRYGVKNAGLAVFGNFDRKVALTELGEKLAKLPAGTIKNVKVNLDYKKGQRQNVRDVEQSHICIGMPGAAAEDRDKYALAVYSDILGGGMSSRLFQNLREKKGLCYSIYSSSRSYRDAGLFSVQTSIAAGNEKRAMDAIREELENFVSEGVSPELLERTKVTLISNFVFARENILARMLETGRSYMTTGKFLTENQIIRRIEAVSAENVLKIAERYANFARYSVSVVSSKKVIST